MVSPATPTPTAAKWTAALQRASAEKLIAFPDPTGLIWQCKSYTVTVENPTRLAAVSCDCPAGRAGRICKHASVVVFARKHGVRPVRPQ